MRTGGLRINQLSPEAYERHLAHLKAMDTKNLQAYGPSLANDRVPQPYNEPPTRGKSAIMEGLSYHRTTFAGLTHDLPTIYGKDSSFALVAPNHYERENGEAVTLRAVAFTDGNEAGLVASIRVYSDAAPLFVPAG